MPRFRILAALLAAAAITTSALAAGASAATPSPYPPVPATAALGASTTDPCPGDTVTLTGAHYGAGQRVTLSALTHNSQIPLTTVTADASGSFSVRVTVPLQSTGNILITGTGSTHVARIDLETCVATRAAGSAVAGAATDATGGSSNGGLAFTGVQIALFAGIGLLAVAVGTLAVVAGRRRTRRRGRGPRGPLTSAG